MASRDEDRFSPQPSRLRGDGRRVAKSPKRFTSQVLRAVQVQGGGIKASIRGRGGKGAEKGRGWVAARLLGDRVGARSRRVVVKARLVVRAKAAPGSTARHLAYIQRDGVTPDGEPGQAYFRGGDIADVDGFLERDAGDRHQFRFIVSAEDATDLGDLKPFTRELMGRMEADLGTRLDWVAVDHFDTDNPHTHIVLRGVDQAGEDLIIARDYISHGSRQRASILATEWLGPQTEREMRERMTREVAQERWTGLDRRLVELQNAHGLIDVTVPANDPQAGFQRGLMIGRLKKLEGLGLAAPENGGWRLRPDAEQVLRDLGERGDIIRTLQRAFADQPRIYSVFDAKEAQGPIIGRLARKGLVDELGDRRYLVVDGIDGVARYVALPPTVETADLPLNGIVAVYVIAAEPRSADRAIAAAVDRDGIYRPDHHRQIASAEGRHGQDPGAFVEAHVRRLEALRRVGAVERLDEDRWRLPSDFLDRAAAFEAGRFGGIRTELLSHLPIERQTRALGVTWLDRRLLEGASPGGQGFGAEVAKAMGERASFLGEEGLADSSGSRVRLARSLLDTLRRRELDAVAKALADQTGLQYRPVEEGGVITGVYRRSLQLVSGRFAMIEDGLGFSLAPWRSVLEPRLGQSVRGLVNGGGVSWMFGRGRGGPAV